MRKIKAIVLCLVLVWNFVFCTYIDVVKGAQMVQNKQTEEGNQPDDTKTSGGPTVSSPSVILMEASTGTVIFEKNCDEKLHTASVTKIMTLLLSFDAIE